MTQCIPDVCRPPLAVAVAPDISNARLPQLAKSRENKHRLCRIRLLLLNFISEYGKNWHATYGVYIMYILLTCYHVTMSIIYPYDDSSIMHPFFVVGEIASSALRGHDKIPLRANRRHSQSLPPSSVVSYLTALPECHSLAPVSMSPTASVIPSEHSSSHRSTAQEASQWRGDTEETEKTNSSETDIECPSAHYIRTLQNQY